MNTASCYVLSAESVATLGDALSNLWLLTVFMAVVLTFNYSALEWRLRRFLRRRRIRRLRAARMLGVSRG